MIKKLFIAVLLAAGANTAGLYAQVTPTQPGVTPSQQSITLPQKQDNTGVDLIQKSTPVPPAPNQQGIIKDMQSMQTQVDNDIPAAVKQSFAAVMPNATNVAWNARGNYYEVTFTSNNINKIRVYDSKGDLQELGIQQEVKSTPASIKSYVKKNYSEAIVSVYKEYMIGNPAATSPAAAQSNNSAMAPNNMDNSAVATTDKPAGADKAAAASKATDKTGHFKDISLFRVTTTTHLLYFDSDGKFDHEGYGMLTSSL